MPMDTDSILTMLNTQEGKADNRNTTQMTFLKVMSDAAIELGQYRELGTVEELREILADYKRLKEENK